MARGPPLALRRGAQQEFKRKTSDLRCWDLGPCLEGYTSGVWFRASQLGDPHGTAGTCGGLWGVSFKDHVGIMHRNSPDRLW